jgi:hypothetical protein
VDARAEQASAGRPHHRPQVGELGRRRGGVTADARLQLDLGREYLRTDSLSGRRVERLHHPLGIGDEAPPGIDEQQLFLDADRQRRRVAKSVRGLWISAPHLVLPAIGSGEATRASRSQPRPIASGKNERNCLSAQY